MNYYLKVLKTAALFTLVMVLLCGLIYPFALKFAGHALFPKQSKGNIVYINGKAAGSELIGQEFTSAKFMKARPSAVNYNTYLPGQNNFKLASGAFNYGQTNPKLIERITASAEEFIKANPALKIQDIPLDLVTASGSGLDPHISIEAAKMQIPAISNAAGLTPKELKEIIAANTEKKFLGIFGTDKVNVLKVNIAIAKKLSLIK